MKKVTHYVLKDWARCGIKATPHMNITTDDKAVTCKNCIRHSAGFIHAEELDYILKTMVDIFTSLAHDEDGAAFQKEHPGLKWKLGFEGAIYEFADRKSDKELMIAALIKSIKAIERKEALG